MKIGDGAGTEAFTTIAEVQKIGGPKLKLDTKEVTSHSSTGGWREFIATLLDAGEVSFDGNFIPTNATQSQSSGVLKDMKNRTKRNFQLILPDTTTWTFAAFVTGFEISAQFDDVLSFSASLKITGAPTLAG
ncbi:MAG: phage tail tube protein [Terrimicrobiaceae bacterium]